jgi:3-methyl-2-oxobutanoate hydroxymethyltransferase
LVTPDLVGGFPWFKPRFAKSRANIATDIKRAAREFRRAVVSPELSDGEDRVTRPRAVRPVG